MASHGVALTRLFSRTDVEALLDPASCYEAVFQGFMRQRDDPASGVFGLGLAGGSFHAKGAVAAAGTHGRRYLATKLNLNLPGNPARNGRPTIQGVLALFDVATGTPLAVMDSAAITVLRTAAATAVAVQALANPDASTVTVVGCGAQALGQLAAIHRVRPVGSAFVVDVDPQAARRFAERAAESPGVTVRVADDLTVATRQSDIIVTCTTSMRPILTVGDVAPGALIAAVGADSASKSEMHPDLMAAAVVVTDDRDQCAQIGDLHHAIEAGTMTRESVRADLAEVVTGRVVGRRDARDIVIYDSTGLGFQDVAAAALVYERGLDRGVGATFDFAA